MTIERFDGKNGWEPVKTGVVCTEIINEVSLYSRFIIPLDEDTLIIFAASIAYPIPNILDVNESIIMLYKKEIDTDDLTKGRYRHIASTNNSNSPPLSKL